MDLKGKLAVVTGGTKGIGKAIATSLKGADADVVVTARNSDEVQSSVLELNTAGTGRASGFACDVRDYSQIRSLFGRVSD